MDELKRFLQRHQMTQRDLAGALGVTEGFVSQVVLGQCAVSLERAKQILAFCRTKEPGLDFDDLFGRWEPPAVAVNA